MHTKKHHTLVVVAALLLGSLGMYGASAQTASPEAEAETAQLAPGVALT